GRGARVRVRDGGAPSGQARAARPHRRHAGRARAAGAGRRRPGRPARRGARGPAERLRLRVIPTLPLAPRNRLAALILAALSDAGARRELAALADCGERALAGDWLGADELRHAGALRARARRASGAMATLPLESPRPSLATALDPGPTLPPRGLPPRAARRPDRTGAGA